VRVVRVVRVVLCWVCQIWIKSRYERTLGSTSADPYGNRTITGLGEHRRKIEVDCMMTFLTFLTSSGL
jgi:hypothetical protein